MRAALGVACALNKASSPVMRRVFWHPNRSLGFGKGSLLRNEPQYPAKGYLFLAAHACLAGIHGGAGDSVHVDRDPAYNLKPPPVDPFSKTVGADEIPLPKLCSADLRTASASR